MTLSLTRVQAQDIIALGGTVSSSRAAGSAPEAIEKLVDKDVVTKYLTGSGVGVKILWKCNQPQAVAQYSLISGNDEQGRDPKDWKLEAAEADSSAWVTLDTRTDEKFDSRGQTSTYTLANRAKYTYYRLNITALYNSTTLFQLAEWGLAGPNPPDAPTNLTLTTTGGQEVLLNWKDNAATESGFKIERSNDGIEFVSVDTINANTASYVDQRVINSTQYYYRIQAINAFGASSFSNVATVTTLNETGELIDLTNDGGVLTVLLENPEEKKTEDSPKLIDNNYSTKYLIPAAVGTVPYWFAYASTTGADRLLTKYTLTSGNDGVTRDPKNWVLEGSIDGTAWDPVETRTNVAFTARNQTLTFVLATPVHFQHYRMRITANAGSTLNQLSEWELWALDPNAPDVPQNIKVTALSKKVAELKWEDVGTSETGYELFRSEDSVTFTRIRELGPDETTFIDEGRRGGLTYHYRMRTVYPGGKTVYSAIVSVTMPGTNNAPTLDPLDDIVTCNASVDRIIPLSGIAPGAEESEDQTVVLSVTIKNDERTLLEKAPAVTEIIDGKATLSFKINPEADADTVILYVQVKDDGGTGNNGIDAVKDSIQIIFEPLPVTITLARDLPLPRGTTIQLKAAGAEQYAWEEGPGIIAGSSTDALTVRPTQGYTYVVSGSNAEGCARTASFFVGIDGSYALDPANILTPDQDGKNDTWVVWNIHIFPGNRVSVYDGAGKSVFSMEDYTNDWTGIYQGSPLANGVYYYVIEPGAGIKPLKGSLTIIRYDK